MWSFYFSTFSVLLYLKWNFVHCDLDPRIESVELTELVKLAPNCFVIGERKDSWEQFLGIPFAQPPVEDLRFRVSFL